MEPKSCVCRPEPDGGLTVWPTTQSIHNVRILLGEIFGIPLSKVNVKRVPVGGTFGSSIQMNPPIPICAALALKAGRPVKLTLTREEDVHDHTRYASHITLKLAARKDGTLTGAQMELLADIGAHNIQAYSFLGVSIGWLVSLYRLPNVRYKGTAVYTNKAISCAMQGFGNPQVTFAATRAPPSIPTRPSPAPCRVLATLRLPSLPNRSSTNWPRSWASTRWSYGSRTMSGWATPFGAKGRSSVRSCRATACRSCCGGARRPLAGMRGRL
jgi:hypothetical protein